MSGLKVRVKRSRSPVPFTAPRAVTATQPPLEAEDLLPADYAVTVAGQYDFPSFVEKEAEVDEDALPLETFVFVTGPTAAAEVQGCAGHVTDVWSGRAMVGGGHPSFVVRMGGLYTRAALAVLFERFEVLEPVEVAEFTAPTTPVGFTRATNVVR